MRHVRRVQTTVSDDQEARNVFIGPTFASIICTVATRLHNNSNILLFCISNANISPHLSVASNPITMTSTLRRCPSRPPGAAATTSPLPEAEVTPQRATPQTEVAEA